VNARSARTSEEVDLARRRVVEAEREYQRDPEDYITRKVRDATVVDAYRNGLLSSRELSDLVKDLGRRNVVGLQRRAITRRDVVPGGMLDPADALRASGLDPRDFILAVREGRIRPVEVGGGVRAFRAEDVDHLRLPSEAG